MASDVGRLPWPVEDRTGSSVADRGMAAVTSTELETLLSPLAKASAVGQMRWRLKKPRCNEGRIDVRTQVLDCELGELRLYYVEPRPHLIHAQYFVNGGWIRRLDVNDEHRGVVSTHKHRHVPSTGEESVYIPDDIPDVPLTPTVAPGTYQEVFEAFAAECHVALPDGYWKDPGR